MEKARKGKFEIRDREWKIGANKNIEGKLS